MMASRTLRSSIVAASSILVIPLTMFANRTLNIGVAKAQAQNACTLGTVNGTYLFHGEGVAMSEGEVRPYAEAGTWTLDGNGSATGVISASIDGEPFATQQAFTATYEHVWNCVYAVVDQFDFTFDLYTTPAGTPMTYFSPGFSGVELKQYGWRKACF